jgi:hypothetical protein
MNEKKRRRREGALDRLKAQLVSGTKRNKDNDFVPLTVTDKNRIKKEIQVLENRI